MCLLVFLVNYRFYYVQGFQVVRLAGGATGPISRLVVIRTTTRTISRGRPSRGGRRRWRSRATSWRAVAAAEQQGVAALGTFTAGEGAWQLHGGRRRAGTFDSFDGA
jgi:hypothetical protein